MQKHFLMAILLAASEDTNVKSAHQRSDSTLEVMFKGKGKQTVSLLFHEAGEELSCTPRIQDAESHKLIQRGAANTGKPLRKQIAALCKVAAQPKLSGQIGDFLDSVNDYYTTGLTGFIR